MDMINRLRYLDKFVDRMEWKIIKRSDKWSEEDELTIDMIKSHLIDEICELFNLMDEEKEVVVSILEDKEIKPDELVDVANMCWICDFMLTDGENED